MLGNDTQLLVARGHVPNADGAVGRRRDDRLLVGDDRAPLDIVAAIVEVYPARAQVVRHDNVVRVDLEDLQDCFGWWWWWWW